MTYNAPEMIHINGRTFYIDDCKTPKEMLEYLQLFEFIDNHSEGTVC